MRLTRVGEPFDHPDFLFELKWDGWRCLANIEDGVTLYSRNGNVYKRFDDLKGDLTRAVNAPCVLDGEIVCLDSTGRPQFYDLLRRCSEPVFVALDILKLKNRALRSLPLSN
jgi:ATP-dependent DNA ligase